MIFINDIDNKSFSLNGITYYKNFLPHVAGENTRIVNQYDTRFELSGFKKFDQYNVDGVVYGSSIELQNALLPVLYTRSSLGTSFLPDELISIGTILKDGNTRTIPIGVEWRIDNAIYTNGSIFSYSILSAGAGLKRIDKTVANTSNSFQYLVGIPGEDVVEAPDTPDNTVVVMLHYIYGDEIDDTPPIIGALYVEKEYYSIQTYTGSGVVGTINMDPKRGSLKLSGTITKLGGIQKNTANYIIGQSFYIISDQPTPIELENLNPSSNWKFLFPENLNYILEDGQIAQFIAVEFGVYKFVGLINKVLKRTGTSIKFDKISYYGSPTVPLTGNLTLDFTNAKTGMIQDIFHQSATIPTIGTTKITGEYQPSALNKISLEYFDNTHVYATIRAI